MRAFAVWTAVLVSLVATAAAQGNFAFNQHASPSERIQNCQVALEEYIGTTDPTELCDVLQDAYFCIYNVIHDFETSSDSAAIMAQAAEFLDYAFALNSTDCNLITVVPTKMREQYGNFVFDLDQSKDLHIVRYTRGSMDLHDLVAPVEALESTVQAIDTMTMDPIAPTQAAAKVYAEAVIRGLAQIPAVNIGSSVNTLGATQALLNAVSRSVASDIPASITNLRTELSQRIANQAAVRGQINGNLASLPPIITAKITSLTSTAMAAHGQIRTDMSTARVAVASNANAQVSVAVAYEVARDVAPAALLSTQVSALMASNVAQVSAALIAEASLADSLCNNSLSSVSVNPPVNSGSTDFGACLSGQAGTVYYSTGSKTFFICRLLKWTPIFYFTPPFADSSILSVAQAVALTNGARSVMDVNWVLCFRASVYGWSSYTMHYNCDWRGPAVSLMKAGTRVWGGFIDIPWRQRSNYQYSQAAFLFRFNPSTDGFERASVSNPSSATYDQISYCTTFGGGHDWYISSGCQSGYTQPNSYTATSYDSSWLAGSYSSWSASEMEVYVSS